MSTHLPDARFWAGTEESFNAYLAAAQWAHTADIKAYYDDDEDEDSPRLLSKQGNVAVISVNGPLVPGAPWYARYRGMTGYDEIRAALIAAAEDPEVGAILLDVNSGGGAVSGVTDVADLVSTIDRQLKPVEALTTGTMASAALWLSAGARKINAGKVAEVGSIGVITVLQSVKAMYEKMGVETKVLRSAEFKAMGHPLDPITEKAEKEISAHLEQMDAMFIGYMAEARGLTPQAAKERFGNGRVFIGQAAADVGLVDSITTYDAVISAMQGAIDSQKERSQYGGNFQKGPVVKNAMTQQQLAALAEGGAAPAQSPGADAGGQAPAAAGTNTQTEQVEKPEAAAPQAPAAQAPAQGELVAFLQGQLAESQAKVTDLTVQLRDAQAEIKSVNGFVAGMRSVVETSTMRLAVALGHSEPDLQGLSNDSLLAQHATFRAEFETKFKVGGVAAVSSSAEAEKTEAVMDDVRVRRIKATRLTTD